MFLSCVRVVPKLSLGHPQAVLRSSTGCPQSVPKPSQECPQVVTKLFWGALKLSLECSQVVPALSPNCPQVVSRLSLGCLQTVPQLSPNCPQAVTRLSPHPRTVPVVLHLSYLLYFSQVRAYVGAFAADFNEDADLSALRFLSVNSIVDPWVFIIFRTSVFRLFVRRLCRRLGSRRATLKSTGPGGDGQFCPLGWRGPGTPQLVFP